MERILDQALTPLELAEAVSKTISEELVRTDQEFIWVHRQCAELAVKFVDYAAERLVNRTSALAPQILA